MYQLPKQLKEEISLYLKSITVPAEVGANIMAIIKALDELELKEEKKEEVKK